MVYNINMEKLINDMVDALLDNFVIGVCDSRFSEDINSVERDEILNVLRAVCAKIQKDTRIDNVPTKEEERRNKFLREHFGSIKSEDQ